MNKFNKKENKNIACENILVPLPWFSGKDICPQAWWQKFDPGSHIVVGKKWFSQVIFPPPLKHCGIRIHTVSECNLKIPSCDTVLCIMNIHNEDFNFKMILISDIVTLMGPRVTEEKCPGVSEKFFLYILCACYARVWSPTPGDLERM